MSPRVGRGDERDGGCNFCTARGFVFLVETSGSLSIRLCRSCARAIARGTGTALTRDRILVGEWWEVWWRRYGFRSVRVDSGWIASADAPNGTFQSSGAAWAFKKWASKKKEKNKFHVVLHVRRYRKASQ